MIERQIRDFTKGNVTKQLITFALPLFLSNLLQIVYNMVDMIVVGNVLGEVGLSAVAIGGDLSNLLTFIAMGFSGAGQVIIAQYIGSKREDKIGKFVGTMCGFLFVCAIVVSVFSIIFQDGMLSLLNTPKESFSGAKSYSLICMSGMVFIYGYNVVSAILRGMGDSKHPFIFISIAAILNLGLDLLFVIKFNMGAGGAALATVISQGVSFISCTIFLYVKRKSFALNMKAIDFIRWHKESFVSLIKLGVPMAIKFGAVHISKLFVNSWINSYGVAVSAFAGVANKIASVAYLVATALSTAGASMVGQNVSAKEYGRVKSILKNLAVITIIIAVILSLLMILFPTEIFALFTDDNSSDVLAIVGGYVPIAILLFFGSALRSTMNSLINGSGDTKTNFLTAILDGMVMRIGLGLLFGLALNMKHYGFWLGDALAGYTPFVIGVVFYFSGKWKKGLNKPKDI